MNLAYGKFFIFILVWMISISSRAIDPKATKGPSYKFEGNYYGDMFENFSGGLKKGPAYLSLLSLRGTFDLEAGLGIKGTTFFISLLGTQGRSPSSYVGDIHTTSNIEARADTGKVYEAWLQKSFAGDRFSVLFGLYDLNSEFYTNVPASFFIDSSFGIGKELSQTGKNGPSIFPVTSVGFRIKARPTREYYLESAVLDAVSGNPDNPYGTHVTYSPKEGVLLVNEVGWTPYSMKGKSDIGKLAFGSWSYSATFDHLKEIDGNGDPIQSNNSGFYILADHQVLPGFYIFARYGQAAEAVNQYHSDFMSGVYSKGLLFNRKEDEFGLAFSMLNHTDLYLEVQNSAGTPVARSETVYEISYKAVFNDNFALQPDIQYVINPGMDPTLANSLSGILRLRFSF